MTESIESVRWVKRKSNYKFCFYKLSNPKSINPILQPQNDMWPGGNEFAIEICGWIPERHSSVKNRNADRKSYITWRVLLSGGQYILVNVLDITPVVYKSQSIDSRE